MNPRLALATLVFAVTVVASDLDAGKRAYEKGDFATALREWRPLADQYNAEAMYLVGSMVFDGKGVKQDKHIALGLFQLAAHAGSAEAELRLAAMYRAGDGVAINIDNSIYWNKRAAEHGVPLAQFAMGVFYWGGVKETHDSVTEIKPDSVIAFMWFSLCSEPEHLCADSRKVLAKEMTQHQIDEAQRRGEEWKVNYKSGPRHAPTTH